MSDASVDPRQAYIQQLGAAHGFSLEQLARNRAGQLHPEQLARGRSSGIGCAVFAILLGLLFAAAGIGGALYLYDDYQHPVSDVDMQGLYALAGGGGLLCVLFLGGAVMSFRKVSKRRSAYARGQALVAEGPLRKVHIEGRGGAPSQWRYEIGGIAFPVSRRAWELTTHAARYRAYHLAGDLLSLEPA